METTFEASAPYQCQPHPRGGTDRRAGRQQAGSTWQNGDFVLSQSTTGQGPFNELLWSGQPAETIFTLMGLMAKPASKPALAKGGRGAAAHTQRGLEPTAREREAGARGQAEKRKRLSHCQCPLHRGQVSRFALCTGGFLFQQPQPLWQQAWLEQLSLEAGCPRCVPGVSPTPGERPRSQRSPWRGFVGNQTQ